MGPNLLRVFGRVPHPAPSVSVSFEATAAALPREAFDPLAALDAGLGKSVNVATVLEGQTYLGPTPAAGIRPVHEEVERQHGGPTRLDPPDAIARAVRRALR